VTPENPAAVESPASLARRRPDSRGALALEIYNQPLLIEQSRLDVMVSMLQPAREGVTPESFFFFFEDPEPQDFITRDGIAWITVHRPYLRQRTYARIRKQIEQALAAQNVRGILLDVDTPGGVVSGLFDLSDFIFESRGTKPIWAIANDDAFSAGYAIASAADHVAVTRTGGIGSIGVIAVHVEYSKMDERIGMKATPIYSGERKVDFIDTEPLNDTARLLLQAEVDRLREIFVETVARNRGASEDAIRETEAGAFFGPLGVPLLADAVDNIDAVFLDFRTSIETGGAGASRSASKESNMAKEKTGTTEKPAVDAEAAAAAEVESKTEKPAAAGADVVSIDAARADGRKAGGDEQRAAAAERTSAIRMACDLAGCPERFGEFLDSDLAPDAVGKKLLEDKRAAGGGVEVRGQHAAAGGDIEEPKIDTAGIYASRNRI